jgi:hypothetical protein
VRAYLQALENWKKYPTSGPKSAMLHAFEKAMQLMTALATRDENPFYIRPVKKNGSNDFRKSNHGKSG